MKKRRRRQWCEPGEFEGMPCERSDGIVHHPREICKPGGCPFHKPSDHIMVDWPVVLRETGLIERICPHGTGHPDPDSVTWIENNSFTSGLGVHGCDGCCRDPLAVLNTKLDRLVQVGEQPWKKLEQ